MADKPQEILFGAGDIYIVPDNLDLGTATESAIEAALVKIGESNGESTLKIEYEFVDVRGGARNQLLKSFMTSETVTFNAGVVSFDLKTINEFLASTYNDDIVTGKRTLGIGGNSVVPIKRLRFVHTKEDGYKVTMDMHKAQNRSGLEWAFNSTEATPFAFEFTLFADQTKDASKGNIVTITEEYNPEDNYL